jgi:hypothetical protein
MLVLYRRFVSLFIKEPNECFGWSVEDFNKAKRYCKYKNHPASKKLTLWDYIYNQQDDSVWTLHKLNTYLGLC